MKSALILSLFLSLVFALDQVYIVVFHRNSTAFDRERHLNAFPMELKHTYDVGDFHGYAAKISDNFLHKITNSQEVAFIERDEVVHLFEDTCHQQQDATWGLDRINERELDLDGRYTWTYDGEGTNSYVIDTGIYVEHQDFEGRAVWGINFVEGETEEDCNGHGTHVAGTMGSKTWGVAKKTTLIAVKVLGCAGSGSRANIMKSIEWVANDAKKRTGRSVANMSLGGSRSDAYNAIVDAAVESGVTFIVAAGNNNGDACDISPASARLAITVGSTSTSPSQNGAQIDTRSSFSNWGTCVDIFAPGSLITATYIGKSDAIATLSGTSMASPHVAGVAALFVGSNPDVAAADVATHLNSMANLDMITYNCASSTSNCSQSPNRLVFTGFCN